MKTLDNFPQIFIFFFSSLIILSGCTNSQVAHPEWDDAYFNSSDKLRATTSSQAATSSQSRSNQYPNNENNNGSINNYPSQVPAGGNYNESNTPNPNATSDNYGSCFEEDLS